MRNFVTLILVLLVGISLGVAGNHFFANTFEIAQPGTANISKPAVDSVDLLNSHSAADGVDLIAAANIVSSNEYAATDKTSVPDVKVNLRSVINALQKESDARNQLEEQIISLQAELSRLKLQVSQAVVRSQAGIPRRRQRGGVVDAQSLINAGFSTEEATGYMQQWSKRQMDLLYLRDRAGREGWLNTERYQQELEASRNQEELFKDELDENTYDRFLFAMGRDNRLQIDTVMQNSPGKNIGLKTGDRIIKYDGKRMYSVSELNAATREGNIAEPISLVIEREGQQVEFYIPRGPIGVSLTGVSVRPTG